MMGIDEQPTAAGDDAWILFDDKKRKAYGIQEFPSEHEAWQARDKALLPSHILPRPKWEVVN